MRTSWCRSWRCRRRRRQSRRSDPRPVTAPPRPRTPIKVSHRRSPMKLLLPFMAVTAVAHAQTLDKKSLSLEGARQAVAAVVAEARAKGVGAAVAVVDDGGNVLAVERVDGTFAAGARISV